MALSADDVFESTGFGEEKLSLVFIFIDCARLLSIARLR